MQFLRKCVGAAMMLGLCALAGCDANEGTSDTADATDAARMDGVDDTTAARAAGANAGCAIVDEAAVEEAVGFDVVMNDNTTGNCVLTPANGDPAAPAFDFRVEPRVTAFDYFSAQADATPITDLGDRAVWATLNEMTGYVVIVAGSHAIVTAVARADGLVPASRQQAEALARVLLSSRASSR